MNNTDLCELAKLYADSKFITVTNFMQIFASIFCLFTIGVNLPLKCLNYKPVALHQNLKVRPSPERLLGPIVERDEWKGKGISTIVQS